MKSKKHVYSDSHKAKDYGRNYDSTIYRKNTYDSKVWDLEKIILGEILENRKSLKTLDFASGTGRVTKFLENINMSNLYGIDNSDEMLKVAKERLKYTKLYNLDLTREKPSSNLNKFKTIISFRFFLNADPSLRKDILKVLNKMLEGDGIIIFNIHGNKKSIRFFQVILRNIYKRLVAVVFNRKPDPFRYKKQLSKNEIKSLLNSCGYKLREVYSYSYIPSYITDIMPVSIWKYIEMHLISKTNHFGTHFIFVATKK